MPPLAVAAGWGDGVESGGALVRRHRLCFQEQGRLYTLEDKRNPPLILIFRGPISYLILREVVTRTYVGLQELARSEESVFLTLEFTEPRPDLGGCSRLRRLDVRIYKMGLSRNMVKSVAYPLPESFSVLVCTPPCCNSL